MNSDNQVGAGLKPDLRVKTHSAVYIIDQQSGTLTRYPRTEGLNAYEVAQFSVDSTPMVLDKIITLEVGVSAEFSFHELSDPWGRSQRRLTTPVISIEEVTERKAEPSWG